MKNIIFLFGLLFFLSQVAIGQKSNKVITPQFKGGENELLNYLIKSVKYPPGARDNCINGTVYVKFVIDTMGNIDSVRVLYSVHPLLDKEAIRVVKSMIGMWTPGSINDSLVRVQFNMPLKFIIKNAGCKDGNYYYNLGVKHYKKRDFPAAIKAFKEAIKINAMDIDALYNCAVTYTKIEDYDSACYYLNRIKEAKKPDADEMILKYCK